MLFDDRCGVHETNLHFDLITCKSEAPSRNIDTFEKSPVIDLIGRLY